MPILYFFSLRKMRPIPWFWLIFATTRLGAANGAIDASITPHHPATEAVKSGIPGVVHPGSRNSSCPPPIESRAGSSGYPGFSAVFCDPQGCGKVVQRKEQLPGFPRARE